MIQLLYQQSREPRKAGRPTIFRVCMCKRVFVCVPKKGGPNWNQLFHWDSAGMRPEHHTTPTRRARHREQREDVCPWLSPERCFALTVSLSRSLFGDSLMLFVLWSDRQLADRGRSCRMKTPAAAEAAARQKDIIAIRSLLRPLQTDLYPSSVCVAVTQMSELKAV